MSIRAVIFDLYGVLAMNGWQAFKAKHFSDREDIWTEVFELGRQVDAGLASYAELVRFTAERTGETEATVRYQLEHTLANTELLHYIATELKPRYKLGILSNASNDNIIAQLFTAAEESLFDSITFSHHVGMTKPDVGMYQVIAGKLGVSVEECLFIDDQERHVTGARAAGMKALLYTDISSLKTNLAEMLDV